MSITTDIETEVSKALEKFPTWPKDPLHAVAVLGEEFGELMKAVLQMTYEPHKTSLGEVRKEAIQTAAMAMRFIRSLDDYSYAQCEQVKQEGFTKYYWSFNGCAYFVKEGDFFISQGGLTEPWGKPWKCIWASSIEDARAKAKLAREEL